MGEGGGGGRNSVIPSVIHHAPDIMSSITTPISILMRLPHPFYPRSPITPGPRIADDIVDQWVTGSWGHVPCQPTVCDPWSKLLSSGVVNAHAQYKSTPSREGDRSSWPPFGSLSGQQPNKWPPLTSVQCWGLISQSCPGKIRCYLVDNNRVSDDNLTWSWLMKGGVPKWEKRMTGMTM